MLLHQQILGLGKMNCINTNLIMESRQIRVIQNPFYKSDTKLWYYEVDATSYGEAIGNLDVLKNLLKS